MLLRARLNYNFDCQRAFSKLSLRTLFKCILRIESAFTANAFGLSPALKDKISFFLSVANCGNQFRQALVQTSFFLNYALFRHILAFLRRFEALRFNLVVAVRSVVVEIVNVLPDALWVFFFNLSSFGKDDDTEL